MHITASVFINDDERGLHADYEVWLEEVCSRLHQAPHAPIDQAGPMHTRRKDMWLKRTNKKQSQFLSS
jgi:thiamine phosphate synthase YjbQ (UPF0047 family)